MSDTSLTERPVTRFSATITAGLPGELLIYASMLLGALVCLFFIHHTPLRATYWPEQPGGSIRGFFDVERLPGGEPYRWSNGNATMQLANPGGSIVATLQMAGGPSRTVPVQVQIGQTVASFAVSAEPRTYQFVAAPIASDMITLQVSSPTIAEQGSNRRLGVVVGAGQVRGNGLPPLSMQAEVLLALALLCAALRLIFPRVWAMMLGLLLLIGMVVWYGLGGWQLVAESASLLGAAGLASTALIMVGERRVVMPGWRALGQWLRMRLFALPRVRADRAFVVVAVVTGALYVTVTPPFQVPDEPVHFFRIYQLSLGHVQALRKDGTAGEMLPANLVSETRRLIGSMPFRPQEKQHVAAILAGFSVPLLPEQTVFLTFPGSAIYSPIPYIPQTIGVGIGRLLALPPVALLYVGRVANVLAYALLVGLALRLMPAYRWVLFLVALLPMAAAQMASLSADGLTNGLAFLFFALILRYATNAQPLGRRDVVALAALALSMGLCKQTYFLLTALCFALPVAVAGSRLRYAALTGGLMALTLTATVVWTALVRDISVNVVEGSSTGGQIIGILDAPLAFAGVLGETYLVQGPQLIQQMTGRLGWLDTVLPIGLLIACWVGIIAVALLDTHADLRIGLWHKTVAGGIVLLMLLLVASALYITFTPVGAAQIMGIQGRYFLPVLPLLLLLLYRRPAAPRDPARLGLPVVVFSLVITVLTLWALVQRYYLVG